MFAIRSVYHFGTKVDGTFVYEERIVSFEAEDFDEAHRQAAMESDAYCAEHGFTSHPHQMGYELDDDPLINSHEVWSVLFQSPLALEPFYERFYGERRYIPDPDTSAQTV